MFSPLLCEGGGLRARLKKQRLDFKNKLARYIWQIVWLILYRPTPVFLHGWRRFLVRFFGGTIGRGVHLYPSSKIWAPWNLKMLDSSCLASEVDCYNVGLVLVESNVVVSQYSYLCTATHNYHVADRHLLVAPIIIRSGVWVAADCFVGPGVELGKGSVILARSSVFESVPEFSICRGNPATVQKSRKAMKDL